MNVTINILELASELADNELRDRWVFSDGLVDIEDKNGCVFYTNEAQEIFNTLYDKYYSIIESCIDIK
jgi:hypothetical protein